MSHYYGAIHGSRNTPVTRCGTKVSGITSYTASWDGAIETNMWFNETEDQDYVEINRVLWPEKRLLKTIYRGPLAGLK